MGIYIDYSSAAMISSIKTRAMVPSSQNLFSDAVMAKMITEELFADIVPMIMACREEYFVQFYDQSISGVSYDIPSRAIGQKLRDVCLLNSDGNEVAIPRLSPDTIKRRQSIFDLMTLRGFFFKDDIVTLSPTAAAFSNFSLRMKYFRRPNNICLTSEAVQVSAIDTVAKIVTFPTMPSSWLVTDTFDCIRGTPGFKSLGDDLSISAIDVAGRTMTLSTLPTGLAVGDWFAHAGFSPIAQIPYEVFNILEQRVAMKMMDNMGDESGLKGAADVYTDMVHKFQTMITPRADGSPKKIVRRNPLFGGSGSVRSGAPWW